MGWRSRNRLAADWFAKIRQNENTLEVEHTDVVAAEEAASTVDMSTKADVSYVNTQIANMDEAIANIDMSTKADISYVDNQMSSMATTSYVDSALANVGGGLIGQVKSVTKVNVYTTTNNSWHACPDLSVTVTPNSANSKFLVLGHLSLSGEQSGWTPFHVRLWNSTTGYMKQGNYGGNNDNSAAGGLHRDGRHQVFPVSLQELHSPNTATAVTYKIYLRRNSYGGTLWINSASNRNTSYSGNGVSTLTVIEVAE